MSAVTLNVAPVRCPELQIRVGLVPFHDGEGLRRLREEHNATHIFLRQGGEILCVPRIANAPDVGDRFETLPLHERLRLLATLVRQGLIDYVHSLDRPIYGHFPITFAGVGEKHNLLAAASPDGTACPDWLAVRRIHDADVRPFYFDRRPAFVGIAFDVRTRREIGTSCSELLALGFALEGFFVGRRQAHEDSRIQPRFRLAGRVSQVDGDVLLLTDCRPDETELPAREAYLETTKVPFEACVSLAFGGHAPAVRSRLERVLAPLRSGPGRLEAIRKLIEHFQQRSLEIVPDCQIDILPLLDSPQTGFPPLDTAPKPVYVLDPTGAQCGTWHDGALRKYGPYSSQTFAKNRPRICVVCQTAAKGRVEQFLQKFLRGLRHPKKDPGPFDQGFIAKYRLEECAPQFFCAEDDTIESYRRAALTAIEHATSRNEKWDLAMIQIERRFRDQPPSANPYLVTKQEFLTHQVPVQEFAIETTELWDGQLVYALNNMALATYSKLGGTPWLLQCDRTIAHELVIGIGSASIGEGRLAERERVVGITTVFTGDGNYRLSNKSQAVPFSGYREALLESLRTAVTTVATDMNWQPKDDVRLIFHAFKPFKNEEARAVKELMDGLGDYDVEYAFVEVVENHPYLIFDAAQTGVWDYIAKTKKGELAPDRGRVLRISDREVLVILTGPRDIKRPEHGMPRPILLRLHPDSTFKDTTYIARQAYSFAAHSWRSFFPSSLPVTVLYSELIAKLLGQLGQLQQWNPSVMLGRIGRSRWFL